jgi:hypothetical protein
VSELFGTYVATYDSAESLELRRDGTYKHMTGRHGRLIETGEWIVTTDKDGSTGVGLRHFFMNWPDDVAGSGQVADWGTYAEVEPNGTVRLAIPGDHYYVKVSYDN